MSAKAVVITRADASAPTTAASHFMISHPLPFGGLTIPCYCGESSNVPPYPQQFRHRTSDRRPYRASRLPGRRRGVSESSTAGASGGLAGDPAVPIRRPSGPARRGEPDESAQGVIAVRRSGTSGRHRTVLYSAKTIQPKAIAAIMDTRLAAETPTFPSSPRPITCSKGSTRSASTICSATWAPITRRSSRRWRTAASAANRRRKWSRCPHENTAAHMAARLCAGHRPRPGRAGARRCRHRQYRNGDAQHVPQPAAGAADGRQGALHLPRRARRHARHPRALRAGAVRPGRAWCGRI